MSALGLPAHAFPQGCSIGPDPRLLERDPAPDAGCGRRRASRRSRRTSTKLRSRLSFESREQIALRARRGKGAERQPSRPDDWVIGSDSVVSVDGRLVRQAAAIATRPRSICASFPGRTMELTSAVALARERRGRLAPCRHGARFTCGRCPTASSKPISMPNGPRSAIASACSAWRAAACNCSTHRRRLFHDPRHAAAPAARRAARARVDCQHDQDRAHRLDRHGQVDRRGDVRARRECRCSTPTPWCASCRARAARWSTRSAQRFPGTVEGGVLDRERSRGSVLDDPRSSPRSRRSSIPRSSERASVPRQASRRAGAAVRYSAAVRNRRRGGVRQGHRRLRARPTSSARACSRAPA